MNRYIMWQKPTSLSDVAPFKRLRFMPSAYRNIARLRVYLGINGVRDGWTHFLNTNGSITSIRHLGESE